MKQFQSLKRLLFFYTLTLLIMLALYYATVFNELATHNKQQSLEVFKLLQYELTSLPNPTNIEVKKLLKKPFIEEYSYQIIFMHASGQTYIHQSTRPNERNFSTVTFPNIKNADASAQSSSTYKVTRRRLSAQLNFDSGQKIYIVLRHRPMDIEWISYQFWLPFMTAVMLFAFALIYLLKRRDDWQQLLAYSDNLEMDNATGYNPPPPLHHEESPIEFLRLGYSLSRISYQLHTRNRRIKTLSHRLKRLVDHAPLPMLMITRQGNISFFNQRFEQVFSTTFQHDTTYTLTDFVMGSDKATQQQLHNLGTQRINRSLLVYALEDKQAYQLHIAPWFGEHDQIHGFTVLLSNINEMLTQNTELQHQNQLLNQQIADMSKLRAVMSHELRTPLNAIIGTLDLVEPDTLNHQQKGVLDTLMQSSHAMLMMLNDMLDIAKMDAGKLEIKQEPTDIFKLSEHVGHVMAANARRRNLELLTLFMPNSPRYIDTDSTRLRQILLNLLDNAIKFTRSGYVALVIEPISHFEIQQILNIKELQNRPTDSALEPITASPIFQLHSINSRQLLNNATDQQQAWICFSVQDTGIGISTEEQQQLFSYFNQANAQISQQFGGSGLGLAISNSFAQLLGGFIQLTSEKGSGSRFNLYLPSQSPDYQPVYHRYPEFAHIHLIAIISQPLGIIYLQRLCEYLSIKASIYSSFGTAAAQQLSQQLQQEAQTHVPILLLDYEYYTDHVAVDISASKTLENTNNALKSFIKSTPLPKILLSMTSERGMSSTFLDEFDSFLTKPLDTALLLSEMIRLAQPTLSKLALPSPTVINEETAPNRANDNAELTSAQDSVETPTLAADSACENAAIKPLILVVEDNLTNQKITCKLLEKIGYRSIVAEDGEQALAVLAAQRAEIALVLMDCRMPVMDGLQATKAIRERGDDITVIALTANNTDEDKSECLAVGMDDFLAKPINKNKLQAVLQHYISQ